MDIPTACTIDEALELQQELLLLQMQWQSNPTDLAIEAAIQEKIQEMDRICNDNGGNSSSSSQGSDAEPVGGASSSSIMDVSSSSGVEGVKN